MKRIRLFDIAKGIGIILVVFGHSRLELGHYLIYMFHMPLFFFLSGIFHKHDTFANQIVNKTNRLIVPFVLFLCILLIFNAIIDFDGGGGYLTPPHLRGIIGPLWFLPSLFTVSIIYNHIMILRYDVVILICVAIAFFGGYIPDRLGVDNYLYLFSSLSVLIFYCLGNLFGRDIHSKNKYFAFMAATLSVILFLMSYWISYKKMHLGIQDIFANKHPENFIMWMFGSATGIMMIISISSLVDGNNYIAKLLAYLGECSLYIFAFHLSVLTVAHHILPNPASAVEISIIVSAIVTGCFLRFVFRNLLPRIFN